jgi:hypothetical protein
MAGIGCKSRTNGELGWEELTTVTATQFKPDPAHYIEDTILTPTRLRQLTPRLRKLPRLAQLVVSRSIDEPKLYELGVLGKVGHARMFVAERSKIADFGRLYWVMVKVLSEKYGCFMKRRINEVHKVTIQCRDHRNIVLWRSMGDDWIQFYARQFDARGYEIMVRRRKIVRISATPILVNAF